MTNDANVLIDEFFDQFIPKKKPQKKNKAFEKLYKEAGSAKQKRQRAKSVKGMSAPKKAVKPANFGTFNLPKTSLKKIEREQKKQIKKARAIRKQATANMTTDQKRQYYMNNLYMPQFIERLDNYFGVASKFSDEQKALLRSVLPRFTKEQLETVVRDNLGLERIMYESEGNYDFNDINENLTADDIFSEVMEMADKLGLLSATELAYLDKMINEYGLETEDAQRIAVQFHEAAEEIDPTISEALAVAEKGGQKSIQFLSQETKKKYTTYLKDPETGKQVINRVGVKIRKVPRKRHK